MTVLFLCTGNAARSVMAGVALRQLRPDLVVDTAGTLTVDGLPISWRTRTALESVGLPYPRHASTQATAEHLARADLVVAMAPEHVEWVRRTHAGAASKTATLKHLVTLPAPLRAGDLGLAHHVLQPSEEVVDPGGGEVDVFIECAREVVTLVRALAPLL